MSFVRTDKKFTIFQFPQNKISCIDGEFSDWNIVPESYDIVIDELKNTKYVEGKNQDTKDFDLKVKVACVKDSNWLYFYVDA